VVKHERLIDNRLFLIWKGQERLRVTNLVRTKPYLVTEVTWLEDRLSCDEEEDLEVLASEVEGHMKDVIRLSTQLSGKLEKEAQDLRQNLFPTPFSFFVGSTFEGLSREQQALLELEDMAPWHHLAGTPATVRLRRERERERERERRSG
jgi:Lon protease-like protein